MSRASTSVRLSVNGEERTVPVAPNATLLEVLREDLGLTGTTHGCELGECSACTVLIDGDPELSCLTLAIEAAGRSIETVEGLGEPEPHSLQREFAERGAAQCGYCTPGMLLTAKHFLETTDEPTREGVSEAIAGNICRCTGYRKIIEAIDAVASPTNEPE